MANFIGVHGGRHITRLLHDRSLMLNTLVMPIISVLIVVGLFGDFMKASQGLEKLDLMPVTVMFIISAQLMNSQSVAASLVAERQRGITDRFFTTPGGIQPYVWGTWWAIFLRLFVAGLTGPIITTIMGMRPSLPALGWLLFLDILVAATISIFAIGFSSLVKVPEATMIMTPFAFILMFLSAGIVPTESFTSLVQPVVRINPITHAVRAGIALDDGPLAQVLGVKDALPEVGIAVLFFAIILVLFAFIAFRKAKKNWQ